MRAFPRSEILLLLNAAPIGLVIACASSAPSTSQASSPADAGITSDDDAAAAENAHDASTDVVDDIAFVIPPSSTFAPPGADGGETCTLPPSKLGVSVALQRVASDPPTPKGGAVTPGTYHVAAVDVFTGTNGATGPTGEWLAHRCSFTDTAYGCVEREGDPSMPETLTPATPSGGLHATWGTTITFSRSCPPASTWIRDYTATPTELHLFTNVGGATVRETMTKE